MSLVACINRCPVTTRWPWCGSELGPRSSCFALKALAVWNAQYMDDAITHLRTSDHEITDGDLRRLSPLQHEHIKMLGNFPFTLPHELAAGQRRQLRGLGDRA